jgi:ABC-2 type transport system ATP-binding protein
MVLRIIHPDTGTIEVMGDSAARAANDRVGYLPEERGLYKKLTVRRMLHYYASLKGMKSSEAHQAISDWLKRFELSAWANKKIETLSKGMSQKVQFIASIVARPELVILDEPFSGLDPVNMEAIRMAILDLRRQGTTVIFSTHDMSAAEKMCDFVFMIYRGNKVLDGTLAEIKSQYGADTIRLRWDGRREDLDSIREVRRVADMGAYQELETGGDPQRILEQLVPKGRVSLFEISQPSLHDIFIRIATPKAADVDYSESDLSSSNELLSDQGDVA